VEAKNSHEFQPPPAGSKQSTLLIAVIEMRDYAACMTLHSCARVASTLRSHNFTPMTPVEYEARVQAGQKVQKMFHTSCTERELT